MLTFKDRLYIPNNVDLKNLILYEHRENPYSGHLGYQKMLKTLKKQYYWPEMKWGTT